tara:strand:+ start:372 stop:743 length:372 start_codon:yes stop_codon:yes gene_type:complete
MPERSKDSYSQWGPKELRDKRAKMGLTKRALAKKLGVSERQYAYYESGHTKVDKPLEYAVRWLSVDPMVGSNDAGTLTPFQKERISRLMNAIHNYPTSNLDERGQKILSQCVDEISMLSGAST